MSSVRYPVKRKEVARGAKVEMREHHMSERTARRTAAQHLREHPTYYQMMPVAEKIMASRERNIHPIRKPRPRPQPVTGYSGRIL
jgi:hypothetical protein